MKIKINTKIIGNCLAIRMRVRKGERERERQTDRRRRREGWVGIYPVVNPFILALALVCVCWHCMAHVECHGRILPD